MIEKINPYVILKKSSHAAKKNVSRTHISGCIHTPDVVKNHLLFGRQRKKKKEKNDYKNLTHNDVGYLPKNERTEKNNFYPKTLLYFTTLRV